MRKLAGLALVGAIAVAAAALASDGGLGRVASMVGGFAPKPSVSANSGSDPAPIDYNCGLPGSGFRWLEQERGRDNWHGDLGAPFHLGGIFVSTVASATGDTAYAVALPVRIREDGTPSSMADVYRMLCAVHPDLGGSGLRPMTPEEKRKLDLGDVSGAPDDWDAGQIPDLYTDGVIRAADEAHIGWEQIRVYVLPPIPEDLRGALATSVASRQAATPTATMTPAPSGETRRYRITVNGYENRFYWNTGERLGVRFDYRLIGEFVLVRPTSAKPWAVTSRRVVTAELKYSSLYPVDRYQVTPKCENESRACRQLGRTSTLRLRVEVDGDEIIARWGAFRPQVRVTGTRTAPVELIDSSFASEHFDDEIGGERLPLQDLYVGPQRIKTYQGRSDIGTSFAYGLERLP